MFFNVIILLVIILKKIENSFSEEIINFITNKKIHIINNFIKESLWLTPLIYIIGTLALLIRNKMYGLQFIPISLLQFAIIVFYLIIFLTIYSLIEYNYIALFDLLKNKEKSKLIKIIGHIVISILYYFVSFCFLYLLIDDSILVIKLMISYFIFWPIFVIFLNNKDIISNFITVIMFITLIINIPMSLGGLKGQKVIYHPFNNSDNYQTYMYYGNYDNLYQFTSYDKVILIPIDSGYIEYAK